MNDKQTEPQEERNGFWRRLALAVEPLGESYDERLEKRVSQLEAEVSRLSGIQNGLDQGRGMAAPDIDLLSGRSF